jgi:hypothetical protein
MGVTMRKRYLPLAVILIFLSIAGAMILFSQDDSTCCEQVIPDVNDPEETPTPILDETMVEGSVLPETTPDPEITPDANPTSTPSPTPTSTPLTFYYFGGGGGGSSSKTNNNDPDPTPDSTEEPASEPTPEPTPDSTEEPASEPTPEPTPDSTEEPAADPAQEPDVEEIPEFPTLALPVISIMALLLILRKGRD